MKNTLSLEDYDPYKGEPDGAERKDFDRAQCRLNSYLAMVSYGPKNDDRELFAHLLMSLSGVCDDLRGSARTLANKQRAILAEQLAPTKVEW